MEPVEIPSQLSSRLFEEKMKRQEETMHHSHRGHFYDIDYFLEEDIANFSKYSESEDLISEKYSLRHLKILDTCTYLGLYYAFACHFQKLACEIEIWKASRKDGRLRIHDPVAKDQYMKNLTPRENQCYFVRFVEENDQDVLEEASDLLVLESDLVSAIRQRYLARIPNIRLSYDPCEGCTIGQGGYILRNMALAIQSEANASDVESGRELITKFHQLCHRAAINLTNSENCLSQVDMMLIFRAFDYEIHWQSLGLEKAPNPRLHRFEIGDHSNSSDESESDDESDLNDSIANRYTRRIVYLGCMKMSPISTYRQIELQFEHLLSKYFLANHLDIPDCWKTFQFVNVYQTSEVITYSHTPTKTIDDLDIQSGDILYCVPFSTTDDSGSSNPCEQVEEPSNPYIQDIREFFENETTKVNVTIKFHKGFIYTDILNRVTGLWKLAGVPNRHVITSETTVSLSKQKRCFDVIDQLEHHFGVDNERRLIIGKTILLQTGGTGYRQLREQPHDRTLQEFCTGKNLKYLLHLVLLPFSIDEKYIHNLRYLEFIICDKRMVSIRKKWLENHIYPQAIQHYQNQISNLLQKDSTRALEEISSFDLYPVSDSLNWPNHITPLPDEWIFEDRLYLKFENSEEVSITEIIESINDNIQCFVDSPQIPQKRRLSEIASDSDCEAGVDSISRKKYKNESDIPKRFVSRGDFIIPPEYDLRENTPTEDEEQLNPFLFDDSPWKLIFLTQPIDLNGTAENNWGGPYMILFDIDDHKVGVILEARTTAASLPQSWFANYLDSFDVQVGWSTFLKKDRFILIIP